MKTSWGDDNDHQGHWWHFLYLLKSAQNYQSICSSKFKKKELSIVPNKNGNTHWGKINFLSNNSILLLKCFKSFILARKFKFVISQVFLSKYWIFAPVCNIFFYSEFWPEIAYASAKIFTKITMHTFGTHMLMTSPLTIIYYKRIFSTLMVKNFCLLTSPDFLDGSLLLPSATLLSFLQLHQ